ncbi:hypothetical protein GCM10022260_25180 [Gaetbulibacter aestuarii]
MDLQGQTINVPSGVTIEYQTGGDIINGTLNFSDGDIISGELLNGSLELTGATAQLKEPTFNFIPNRWDIVEGEVDDMVAYDNKLILNKVLKDIQLMGGTTFKIDKLDAYFQTQPWFVEKSQSQQDSAIQVPAGMHLIMTNNTNLRVQPNNGKRVALLAVYKADNAIVEGGVLHGDRDTHDYSDGGTHEWGHVLIVKASKNVIIKNMTLMDAGGDGIAVNAYGHASDSNYIYCDNVLITGNKIIRSRRNGLSITDGRNIIVENNEFIDSGTSTSNSSGVAPMWALDIEPYRSGGTIYEIAEDITIRNNIEKGSAQGGFIIYTGDRITIESNTMENGIHYRQTSGSIIRNNKITGVSDISNNARTAIGAENRNGNKDNVISGNTISGFNTGINVGDYNSIEVFDNVINDCGKAIGYQSLLNAKIHDNTITSCDLGIGSQGLNVTLENSEFYNNIITDCKLGFNLNYTNVEELSNTFTIRNNTFESSSNSEVKYVKGLEFINNNLTGDIRVGETENSSFRSNTIVGQFKITSGCKNLMISDNYITDCFWDNNNDDYSIVNIVKQNNSCN